MVGAWECVVETLLRFQLTMPKAGVTTIWADWAGPDSKEGGIGSLNHYSKGAVVEWLFPSMCDIHVTRVSASILDRSR